MRHGVKLNRLGRKTAHRKALMSNMASQLIQYKRIVTTVAKAKALRVYVEPILTKSKNDTTHNRRLVFSELQNKESIIELFSTVSEKIANRPGGYTRIIKLAPRAGDAAEMAMIELVDFNTLYTGKPVVEEAKKTRRSRATKKATTTSATTEATEATTTTVAPTVEDKTATDQAEEAATATAKPEAEAQATPEAEAQAATPEAEAQAATEAQATDEAEATPEA